MYRDEWGFAYTIGQIAEAAGHKVAFHTERLAWWEGKKTEVFGKIRADGIQVDESVAEKFASNYNRGPTIKIRDDLAADLQEIAGKIKEHQGKVREYDGWCQVLAAQKPTDTRDLAHGDWLFFFGK